MRDRIKNITKGKFFREKEIENTCMYAYDAQPNTVHLSLMIVASLHRIQYTHEYIHTNNLFRSLCFTVITLRVELIKTPKNMKRESW